VEHKEGAPIELLEGDMVERWREHRKNGKNTKNTNNRSGWWV
jgi:hypothetical protein